MGYGCPCVVLADLAAFSAASSFAGSFAGWTAAGFRGDAVPRERVDDFSKEEFFARKRRGAELRAKPFCQNALRVDRPPPVLLSDKLGLPVS